MASSKKEKKGKVQHYKGKGMVKLDLSLRL